MASEDIVKSIFWQSDKSENFVETFDITKVTEIKNSLDYLIETNNIDEAQINEIVINMNELFESCAKESFGRKTIQVDLNIPKLSLG